MADATWWDQVVTSLSRDPAYILGALGIVFGVGAAVIISVVAIAGEAWQRVRVYEELNHLKLEMLAQGMSADDVVKVVTANSAGKFSGKWKKWQSWCTAEFNRAAAAHQAARRAG